jgi:hypothetical protein
MYHIVSKYVRNVIKDICDHFKLKVLKIIQSFTSESSYFVSDMEPELNDFPFPNPDLTWP